MPVGALVSQGIDTVSLSIDFSPREQLAGWPVSPCILGTSLHNRKNIYSSRLSRCIQQNILNYWDCAWRRSSISITHSRYRRKEIEAGRNPCSEARSCETGRSND